MANLKAAVSKGADSVYLGMQQFSARQFATNFNEEFLKEAVKICHSNNVKVYLAMNTLIKNSEINNFFRQLNIAYLLGVDAVIVQEYSLINPIKASFPGLDIHISTQSGVLNSAQANLLEEADSITLARELTKEEISIIRKNFSKKLEIFCHGALCVCISGSCLFSSLLGGRSGNRGRCAQPCRKKYDNCFYLSTKELCLIKQLPEIAKIGVDIIKIEGRMRTPYYVATVTEAYRKSIDDYYKGQFDITKETLNKLESAFTRDFTEGWFSDSKDMFNTQKATGISNPDNIKETYFVSSTNIEPKRKKSELIIPKIKNNLLNEKKLLVRVYSKKDAVAASNAGADIIYLDIFHENFVEIKKSISCKLFAFTPRIMLDSDIPKILNLIKEKKPDGLFLGNIGLLNQNIDLPIHLDYNCNCFNDLDVNYFSEKKCLPIISPELSLGELKNFRDKRFIAFVHGKIRLMTLRQNFTKEKIKDEKAANFLIKKIYNGSEIINEKELGLLSKTKQLLESGINHFFVDTDKNVEEIVSFYRRILDKKQAEDSKLKKNYVLGWAYRGVY
jgi:collagenase-like PrtC family protease